MIEIKRDAYLQQLTMRKDNGMIKVITGIRRCGKSFLLFNIFKRYLQENGVAADHIIEIALDSIENEELRDPKVCFKYIKDAMKMREVAPSLKNLLTQPLTMLEPHQRLIDDARTRMRIGLTRILDDASLTIEKAHASLTALSPQSTLNRGYAVVQGADGHVIDDANAVNTGDQLTMTLKHGVIVSEVTTVTKE